MLNLIAIRNIQTVYMNKGQRVQFTFYHNNSVVMTVRSKLILFSMVLSPSQALSFIATMQKGISSNDKGNLNNV